MSQKLDVSEESWIPALNSILEDLDPEEYTKLLFCLTKIPEVKQKSKSSRTKMARVIIKHYGLLESISVVDHVMVEIPRMDQRIQDKLRPFVDHLKREQENKNQNQNQDQNQYKDQDQDKDQGQNKDQNKDQGKKRKHEDKTLCPSPGKRPVLGPRSCQADNVNIPARSSDGHVSQDRKAPWKSISEVKSSGNLEGVTFRGSVIQKSVLLRSKNNKFYFYVAAADETACVKLVVFGRKHHCFMKEGHPYMFSRSLIKDREVVMVTTQSKVMETFSVIVPEEVQLEARHLIYRESPVFSIKDIKGATAKTEVTVEGKVTAIYPAETVKIPEERKKIKIQKFEVQDETDAIEICMWDETTREMDGLSVGDDAKVTNVKVKRSVDTKLNSTRFTKIHKVQSAGKQEERISIVAVGDHSKEIHLVAELNQELRELVVAPRLLAKAFGFKLDGGVRDWLKDRLPLSVNVQIQGCKITEITATS